MPNRHNTGNSILIIILLGLLIGLITDSLTFSLYYNVSGRSQTFPVTSIRSVHHRASIHLTPRLEMHYLQIGGNHQAIVANRNYLRQHGLLNKQGEKHLNRIQLPYPEDRNGNYPTWIRSHRHVIEHYYQSHSPRTHHFRPPFQHPFNKI